MVNFKFFIFNSFINYISFYLSEKLLFLSDFQKLDPNLSDNFKKVKIEEINALEQDLQKSQQNGNSLINLKTCLASGINPTINSEFIVPTLV